jgi:hypothetical protein
MISEKALKLASMTLEDFEEMDRKASLLTEEERSKFSEFIDLGETTIEEFEQFIGARPLDEVLRHGDELIREAHERKQISD